MASPYVPDTSQFTNNLLNILMSNRQTDRQDQILQQKQRREKDLQKMEVTAAQALRLRELPSYEQKRTGIIKMAQSAIEQGGDPQAWENLLLLGKDREDELNLELRRMSINAATAGNMIKGKADKSSRVQSSEILPGGVVQIVRDDGTVEVKQPDEVSTDIIKRAEDRGVKLQQKRAQGRQLGKDAGKVSTETTKQVGTLRSNNATLRQVIKEVEGGAETGPLAAKLPSFRAESVRLDQLRNKLGLDVVGSVTFGALSEGELNLALSTALPTNLDGPELIKWSQDKIDAQEKLANYLEDQAIYLATPGATPAGWLELKKSRTPQSATTVQPSQVGRFKIEVE